MASKADATDDIAIIGMSCRVAGASSPAELFESLSASRDVQSEITRFNSRGYYSPNGGKRKGLTNVKHAYFLDEDISRFDNEFFSISPKESIAIDPQQRLLLELAYEAFENAGIPLEYIKGSKTGTFCGLFTNDYNTTILRDIDTTPTYLSTGASNSIAANRISYVFDLHGPSMVIDTACSSTIVALHQAILSLKNGESSMSLVCGANLIINPDMFVHMSELGFLSPTGRCRSFDASADGYARGEGVLAILLKPVTQALADGDQVRAVIKGSLINQDGKTNGLTMPSSEAQQKNMQELYSKINIDPQHIQYFEAHATGTPVGDPIETSAVRAVYGSERRAGDELVIGSVKSNVGHLEACAALVGIIKTVECIERRSIPPQLNFEVPNPKIDFEGLVVPRQNMTWPNTTGVPLRAAVNSFGFGGTNGHLVLERHPSRTSPRLIREHHKLLFRLSASNHKALRAQLKRLAHYVERHGPDLVDLAFTLVCRRTVFKRTHFVVAATHEELVEALLSAANAGKSTDIPMSPKNSRTGWVFTGQGAQWAGMGKELLTYSRVFARTIDYCDQVLAELPDSPEWTLRQELAKPAKDSLINISSYSQPLCTALQLGLVDIWKSWGLRPSTVFGHSSGEIAAAYCAHLLSLRDAIIVAFYRGKFMGVKSDGVRGKLQGAMCAVGIDETACDKYVSSHAGHVVIAAVNSPSSCTLSGDEGHIDEIVLRCREDAVFCRKLKVDMAYHSHHMLPLSPLYEQALKVAKICETRLAVNDETQMFSSVYGRNITQAELSPSYWAQNMISPVRFMDALIAATHTDDVGILIEIGPHPALKGPCNDSLAWLGKPDIVYLHSCMRGKSDFEALLSSVGILSTIKFPMLYKNIFLGDSPSQDDSNLSRPKLLTDLPPYAWDHDSSFWAESRISSKQRQRPFPRHSLLGSRVHFDNELAMSWRSILSNKELSYLNATADGRISKLSPLLWINMVYEAYRQVTTSSQNTACTIRRLSITNALSLPKEVDDHFTVETQLQMSPIPEADGFSFIINALIHGPDTSWKQYCHGSVHWADPSTEPHSVLSDQMAPHQQMISSTDVLDLPMVEDVEISSSKAKGRVVVDASCQNDEYFMDPSLMQSLGALPGLIAERVCCSGEYKLQSIEEVQIITNMSEHNPGKLCLNLDELSEFAASTTLAVNAGTTAVRAKGVILSFQRPAPDQTPNQSILFRTSWCPDITRNIFQARFSVAELIDLATHKWPMCDIGITTNSDVLFDALGRLLSAARPRFRSIYSLQPWIKAETSNRVHFVENFSTHQKFHLIFTDCEQVADFRSHLVDQGLFCVPAIPYSNAVKLREETCVVAEISGPGHEHFVLLRAIEQPNGVAIEPQTVICHNGKNDAAELTGLSESLVWHVGDVSPLSSLSEVDAIILDTQQHSLLTRGEGATFLSWLKELVEKAKRVLWVTLGPIDQPHQRAAGAFIRTLRSEYPGLDASTVTIADNGCTVEKILEIANDAMSMKRHGYDEVEIRFEKEQLSIQRHEPDNILAAEVGAAPAQFRENSPVPPNYEICVPCPGQAVMLTAPPCLFLKDLGEACSVAVEASLINPIEGLCFADFKFWSRYDSLCYHFFVGKMMHSSRYLKEGDEVLGWCRSRHTSHISVSHDQIQAIPSRLNAISALTAFGAIRTAQAIVHGIARLRKSDLVSIQLSGPLREAIAQECSYIGCRFEIAANDANFAISFDTRRGILLNGNPIASSMITLHEEPTLVDFEAYDGSKLSDGLKCFDISHSSEAYQSAIENPLGSILSHKDDVGIVPKIMAKEFAEAPLFAAQGAYVLVGGLGGLGKIILHWMIQSGARNLFLLSRRTPNSSEARQLIKETEAFGCRTQVLQVDACDMKQLSVALDQVRSLMPIRGCINLAMVLRDAPFSSMTPEQWNVALRTKVDSTWNLHNALLNDDLDMFIMLSSITSIAGNRAQANYATGNAFQNAVAQYRHSMGLTGVAVALGAVKGVGVIADNDDLLRTFELSGLRPLLPHEVLKIFRAAVLNSYSRERSLLVTGFQMYDSINGRIEAPSPDQIFWGTWPEFGFLFSHLISDTSEAQSTSLIDDLTTSTNTAAASILLKAFVLGVSTILGYDAERLDPTNPLSAYGLDSLNAVACRYWFFRHLNIDVRIFDILGSRSITDLVDRALKKWREGSQERVGETQLKPQHHDPATLQTRPLSHSQSRLWFLQHFIADKTLYNLLLVCCVDGKVNVSKFRQAWTTLCKRHEVLRSKLTETEHGLQQIPLTSFEMQLEDIYTSDEEWDDAVNALTSRARRHEFSIEQGELLCSWLLISPTRAEFYLASHHLAWDRSSVSTIFTETSAIYKSLIAGEDAEVNLQPVSFQFIDYTLWQNALIESGPQFERHVDYWRQKLDDAPVCVSLLPCAHASERPQVKSDDFDAVYFELDTTSLSSVKDFCGKESITPFMFMTSVICSLLYRLTGDEDIVVGIADGDRGHTAFDELIGFTVNMLALRSHIHGDEKFDQVLENLRRTCLEAYEHRCVPFDYLLQQLQVPRRTSHNPLFQVTVNYLTQGSFPLSDYGDFQFTGFRHFNARTQSDLTIEFEEQTSGGLECKFEFDSTLYDHHGIESFGEIFKTFISNVITSGGQVKLDNVDLISKKEQMRIQSMLRPNHRELVPADADQTFVPTILKSSVAARPTHTAVIDHSRALTYLELDIASNRIANLLIERGSGVGDFVLLCSEPNFLLPVSILGILKAGGAYVPINPDFPTDRIESMCVDVGAVLAVVDRRQEHITQKLLLAGVLPENIIDTQEMAFADLPSEQPDLTRPTEDDSICCIFTSGSTGRPKGVKIGHRQLRLQLQGFLSEIGTTKAERFLLSSSFVFDASMITIFGAILHASTMIIASREDVFSPVKMAEFILAKDVSTCFFTPSQMKVLLDARSYGTLKKCTSLRRLILGGEAISSSMITALCNILPSLDVWNIYGPSETTICNTIRRLTHDDAHLGFSPLGPPFYPSKLYIVDKHMNDVPIGFVGELLIGGRQVNTGYVNRPDLTEQVFLQKPLRGHPQMQGDDRLYRTGDSFRLHADGTLQCCGRIGSDRQVKIRGIRVELDEIESVLYEVLSSDQSEQNLNVSILAAVFHRSSDGLGGMLAVYLATQPPLLHDAVLQKSLESLMRVRLTARLPAQMLPSAFCFVDSLPMTVSGKTDYRTITGWKPPKVTMEANKDTELTGELTKQQLAITDAWKDVLDLPAAPAVYDDFFTVGGHSLVLINVQDKIRETQKVEVSLSEMFANPTVAGMASLVASELRKLDVDDVLGNDAELLTNETDSELIDWHLETSLQTDEDWAAEGSITTTPTSIAITGATSMIGAHFIHEVLTTTNLQIHCLAVGGHDDQDAHTSVLSSLEHWNLLSYIAPTSIHRLAVHSGSLNDPTLSLSNQQTQTISRDCHAFYLFDSEVSLLKRYESLRAGNVTSLRFLINLARGSDTEPTKPIHFLSTWGVPHLQAWSDTSLSMPGWKTTEMEMSHMTPSSDQSLGYLKARWVCERLLSEAAARGIPVTIYRSCMCAPSQTSDMPLGRTDINRRILEASLQVGAVPDFSSGSGGGMSWIDASFLVKSMAFLSQRSLTSEEAKTVPDIHHLVSDTHVLYKDLARVLGKAHDDKEMRSVPASEWFEALRKTNNQEMVLHAEVLEKWCKAGWVPFGLEATETLGVLEKEGIVPPMWDGQFLRRVVGNQGF